MLLQILGTVTVAVLWEVLLTRRTLHIVMGRRKRAALTSGAIELVSLIPVLFLLHADTLGKQITLGVATAAACVVGNYLATRRTNGNTQDQRH